MKRLGIAAESPADVRRVTGLVDRLLVEEIAWIEPEVLDAYRSWCGPAEGGWLDVHDAYTLARRRRLPIYGHFGRNQPGDLDAHMHRAALLLFAYQDAPPAAVVVARDMDQHGPARRQGWEEAVAAREWPFEVVGALADPELEAWLVAVWEPENEEDRGALSEVRARIGFDPTRHPDQLTSRRETDPKDCKRVLGELCAHGRLADERWRSTPLRRADEAGAGLGPFVAEVRRRLVPVVSGIPARAPPD